MRAGSESTHITARSQSPARSGAGVVAIKEIREQVRKIAKESDYNELVKKSKRLFYLIKKIK